MLSCKEVTRLVSEGLDRRLSLRERFGLRMHLAMCKVCPRYRAQLHVLHRILTAFSRMELAGGFVEGERLSDQARDSIKRELRTHLR